MTHGRGRPAAAIPANVCVRNALADDCNWRLTTRTGAQAHFAIIVDQDTKGTEAEADDTTTVIAWAIKTGVSLSANDTATGETLTIIADADMVALNASFASPPSGMDVIVGYPVLELGAEGRIPIIAPVLDATNTMTRVPKTVGPLAGATLGVIAQARDAADKVEPATLRWLRNVNASGTVAVNDWLLPPSSLAASSGTFSFAAVAGATLHGAEIRTMAGERLWSVSIFDGSTSFTLPGLSPAPIPAGMTRLQTSALQIPGISLTDVRLDDARDKITALSIRRDHLHQLRLRRRRAHATTAGSPGSGVHGGGGGACGGGGGISGPPVPRLIPGGGIGDGKISGYLNVFVIDDETDAVVSSAAVRVGESASTTACDALTDSTGIASFDPQSCPSLVGPVNVTVSATGYAPSTWIGVNGRNLTVGVRSISAPAFGSATVYGTIAGWDALPAPAVNHQTLAIIGASQLPGLGDRENDMAQGKRTVDVDIGGTLYPVDIDANICARNALVNDCNWRLITRTGAQAHFGIIVDHDTRGTDDDRHRRHVHGDRLGAEAEPVVRQGRHRQRRGAGHHPRRRHAEPGGVVRVGAFRAGLRRRAARRWSWAPKGASPSSCPRWIQPA